MTHVSLQQCFENSAKEYAEKTAVSFLRQGTLETEITYRQLNAGNCSWPTKLLKPGN